MYYMPVMLREKVREIQHVDQRKSWSRRCLPPRIGSSFPQVPYLLHTYLLHTVTTPTLAASTSPLYNTTYFRANASSYGAKAFCYYKYGSGIASQTALTALLSPEPNAIAAPITSLSSFFAAPSQQVKVAL